MPVEGSSRIRAITQTWLTPDVAIDTLRITGLPSVH